jgi:hypothetical protein
MKPTSADFWFWEALQSRDVPEWARSPAVSQRRWPQLQRDKVASALHAAINARAGIKSSAKLDVRNALSMLAQWRDSINKYGCTFAGDGNERPRTITESMRASLRQWGTNPKTNPRAPTYIRILRRMARKGLT